MLSRLTMFRWCNIYSPVFMETYIICGLTFMEEYEMSCSISYFFHCVRDCVGDFRGCFHWCMWLSGGNYKQTPYSQCQRPQLLAWVNRCSLNISRLERLTAQRLMPFCNVSECCVADKKAFCLLSYADCLRQTVK